MRRSVIDRPAPRNARTADGSLEGALEGEWWIPAKLLLQVARIEPQAFGETVHLRRTTDESSCCAQQCRWKPEQLRTRRTDGGDRAQQLRSGHVARIGREQYLAGRPFVEATPGDRVDQVANEQDAAAIVDRCQRQRRDGAQPGEREQAWEVAFPTGSIDEGRPHDGPLEGAVSRGLAHGVLRRGLGSSIGVS